jgi:hypothetical protein
MRLAGQLIWNKDSIPRSMTLEAMERELIVLKKQVLRKKSEEKPRLATRGSESHPPNKSQRTRQGRGRFCAEQAETRLQSAPIPILGNRYSRAGSFTLVATGICTHRKITDKPIMRQSSKTGPESSPDRKRVLKIISYNFCRVPLCQSG